jgi:cation diffusion facilitator family transporter
MRSTLLGILVNLGLSAAKISAGAVGHSFALVADGLESGADVLSGLVVFFGLRIAIKPPDKDHPYGHGKAEPIAALCVGLSLVAAAVTMMVESIHEILTPHLLSILRASRYLASSSTNRSVQCQDLTLMF